MTNVDPINAESVEMALQAEPGTCARQLVTVAILVLWCLIMHYDSQVCCWMFIV